jgi:hypothetical protein
MVSVAFINLFILVFRLRYDYRRAMPTVPFSTLISLRAALIACVVPELRNLLKMHSHECEMGVFRGS